MRLNFWQTQEGLERSKHSHEEVSQKCETFGQQVEFLQHKLDLEIKSQTDKMKEDLMAEQEAMRQNDGRRGGSPAERFCSEGGDSSARG